MLKEYRLWFSSALRLADALATSGLLFLIAYLYGAQLGIYYGVAGVLVFLLTLVVFEAVGLYRAWRTESVSREYRIIFIGWLIVIGIMLLLSFATKRSSAFSRVVFLSWFFSVPLVLVILRAVGRSFLKYVRRQGKNVRTAVIAGADGLGVDLSHNLRHSEWMGISVLGYFDDNASLQEIEHPLDAPILGTLEELPIYIKKFPVDLVFIALPMTAETKIRNLMDVLQDTTVSIFIIPDVFAYGLLNLSIYDINGIPALSMNEAPTFGPAGIIKRIEDIMFASFFLIMALPLMLLIASLIKLESRGPAIFKQRRYGLDGKEIVVWKFRTMTVCEDDTIIRQAMIGDMRVTRFGAVLRKTSLDELPQFINVLQGTMSIVGPRPHAVVHNEHYRKLIRQYMWRHKVKPGITGWAQINGLRGETATIDKMEKRVEHDLWYIRNWSLWLDLKIILLTMVKGFSSPQAY